MPRASDESPGSFLDVWSASALLVLVAGSYGPAMMLADAAGAAAVGALGLLFLAATLGGAWHLERAPRPRAYALVFGAQLVIAAASAVLSEGRTLLSPLATASLAVLYLPPAWRIAAIGGVAGVMITGIVAYTPSWLVALQAVVSSASAGAFVVAFSHLALSRHRARLELARAHARLRAQTEEIALLAAERERLHLAREIHDSIGHWLTSAHVHLETARAVAGVDDETCRRSIESAATAHREALTEVRQSVRALRGPADLGASLATLLEQLVEDTARSGIEATFRGEHGGSRMRPEVELALYRVAQEALTNVRRHAGAQHVAVSLEQSSERVVLTVEDDGAGVDEETIGEGPRADGSGHGLHGIGERVAALGGRFTLQSAPGEGARLRIEVPR